MAQTELNVALISHSMEPQLTIAMAGRLCYSPSRLGELKQSAAQSAEATIQKLRSANHFSPIEHASFTFGVEGVSRALMAQITRHRIASFSVQSQRYVANEELNYIIPPSVSALGEDAVHAYEKQMDTINCWYADWMKRGIPAEDARFLLPTGAETRMIFTMNARELNHFFHLRCCYRAQWEIRRLAWAMLGMLRREAGVLFNSYGPSCLEGACPEGPKSCGKLADMRALSDELNALCRREADDHQILKWVKTHIR